MEYCTRMWAAYHGTKALPEAVRGPLLKRMGVDYRWELVEDLPHPNSPYWQEEEEDDGSVGGCSGCPDCQGHDCRNGCKCCAEEEEEEEEAWSSFQAVVKQCVAEGRTGCVRSASSSSSSSSEEEKEERKEDDERETKRRRS